MPDNRPEAAAKQIERAEIAPMPEPMQWNYLWQPGY